MAGRFPTAWMDDFYSRVDIVQVVSAYVPLKKNGSRYWGLCPFHHEKTPSFSVNGEQNLYYCFGCKAGGNVVQFVEEMEHLTYREAVEYLAKQIHMPIPETQEDPDYERRRSQRERLLGANKAAARWYHAQLWLPENQRILDYLHKRGLDDGTIRKFGLGAAPEEWDALTRALEQQGYTQEELRLAGLTVVKQETRFDMFRSRAIFPIIDAQGRVLGFGGRALGDVKPKYLNTGDTPIFNKRLGVFAANLLKKQRGLKRVILTEGYMDVIALVQAGVPGVCATLGTALTLEQARLLKRYAPEIWVSYDGDAAGQHAILRALDIFEEEGVPARVLDFPGGMDPDEYIKTYGPQSVEQLRPTDATAYRMKQEAANHDLSTEEGRTAYAIACAKYLAKVKEPVELENYVKQLMVSTGFTREVLLAQIGRTELIEENKRPMFRHAARPLEEKNDGVDTETAVAEKGLLVLLAEGGIEPGTISADDFISPQRRALAQKLLDGLTPAAILEEMDDEEKRSRTAKLLSSESGAGEQELRMVADYLRVLEKKRKENEIKALKEKMSTQQGEEKRGTLIKIQELLAQENKTGRRE